MVTVVCVYVKGHVPFSVDYVRHMRDALVRWMDRPYRFACLTDRPLQLPCGVEPIPIVHDRAIWGWWAKVRLWDQSLGLTGRVLYLDLDTLIVAPLAPILDYPSSFALIPHAGNFQGFNDRRKRRRLVQKFNSSVMVWDAGVNRKLFDRWTPAVAGDLHGDQDWVAEQKPNSDTMPLAWFPRISELGGNPPNSKAKVVLVKCPKNEEAARRWPWFEAAWRAA